MLALAFLVMIGATLIAEGFDLHIEKCFIYGPIAFAIVVEGLNLAYKSREDKRNHTEEEPVRLRQAIVEDRIGSPRRRLGSGQQSKHRPRPDRLRESRQRGSSVAACQRRCVSGRGLRRRCCRRSPRRSSRPATPLRR